jgi:plastocyanin
MMNSKIAVAIRLAVILVAAILMPPTTTTATAILAYAVEEIAADITEGSSAKTIDAYSPNPIDARIGDTIIWTNRDSTPHTVTSGQNGQPDGSFDSSPNFNPLMAPGQTFEHTFTEAGEYPYYCALHPNMVGTVIVTAVAGGGGNQTTGQEFRVTATDEEGNEHEITGISENVTATSFAINPGQSVQIQFEGTGEVELTLPKSLIANITAVQAGTEVIQYTAANETDTSTTISFEVPEGQNLIEIMGGFVVPEFPVIAAILAGTIMAVIGLSGFSGSRTVFFGGA